MNMKGKSCGIKENCRRQSINMNVKKIMETNNNCVIGKNRGGLIDKSVKGQEKFSQSKEDKDM